MTTRNAPEWTAAFSNLANGEGWNIFNDDEIQRDDELAVFDSDDTAIRHVHRRAAEGSVMHQVALDIHAAGEIERGARSSN